MSAAWTGSSLYTRGHWKLGVADHPRPRHRGAAQKIIPAPEEAKAIPALDKEALAAGSAHIDTVSGATYTSGGYVTSLQSALDKAGL